MRVKGIVFTGKTIPLHPLSKGKVLEWLKRHAWKACKRQKRFGGSNPPLSAKRFSKRFLLMLILVAGSKNLAF